MLNIIKPILAVVLCCFVFSTAHSAIIGVDTQSNGNGDFERTDQNGNPINLNFNGPRINEAYGNYGFGSAIIIDSTSDMGNGTVEFQNGNASYGDSVKTTSRTEVNIFYTNTTDQTILPTFTSQFMEGGLGMFTTSCLADDLRVCEIGQDDYYNLQNAGLGVSAGGIVASTEMNFQILSGDQVLFELSGGMSLIKGESGQPNYFVTDFSNIENFLNNFRETTNPDEPKEKTYDWDRTDLLITLPDILALAPDEVGSLTYVTEVTTFSDSFCLLIEANVADNDCTVAYAGFGDPVGRGNGGSGPRISGLDFALFEFKFPSFEDGIVEYRVDPRVDIINDVPVSYIFSIFLLSIIGIFFRRTI